MTLLRAAWPAMPHAACWKVITLMNEIVSPAALHDPIGNGHPVSAPQDPPVTCRPLVRYYRRMKPQRIYAFVVEVKNAPAAFVARPVLPGAIVTPTEGTLDAGRVTFHVTPLARGRLAGARVEFWHGGRVVQSVALPARVVTQRLTWLLAFLALFVPAFLLYVTSPRRPAENVQRLRLIPFVPDGGKREAPRAEPPAAPGRFQPPQPKGPAPMTRRPADAGLLALARPENDDDEKDKPRKKDEPKAADDDGKRGEQKAPVEDPEPRLGIIPPRPAPPGGPAAPPGPEAPRLYLPPTLQPMPGEALRNDILQHVPELPEDFLAENPWCPPVTHRLAHAAGVVYDYAHALRSDYMSFWVFVIFLCFTTLSLVTHRSVRGRRAGKPFAA